MNLKLNTEQEPTYFLERIWKHMAAPAGHLLRSDDYGPDLELGVDNNSGGRQIWKSLPHCQIMCVIKQFCSRTVPVLVAQLGGSPPHSPGPQTPLIGVPRQGSRLHHLTEAPAQQVKFYVSLKSHILWLVTWIYDPCLQVRANIVAEVRAAQISALCAVLLRLIEARAPPHSHTSIFSRSFSA